MILRSETIKQSVPKAISCYFRQGGCYFDIYGNLFFGSSVFVYLW